MNRRSFLSGALAGLVPVPALARDRVDDVVNDLRRLGYDAISISRTLLGRTRIVASGTPGQREIVINPRTGEILRDFWAPASGATSGGLVGDDSGDDDNGDDDNSGEGSGNSGSGNGGEDDDGGGDDGGGDHSGGNSGPGGGDD